MDPSPFTTAEPDVVETSAASAPATAVVAKTAPAATSATIPRFATRRRNRLARVLVAIVPHASPALVFQERVPATGKGTAPGDTPRDSSSTNHREMCPKPLAPLPTVSPLLTLRGSVHRPRDEHHPMWGTFTLCALCPAARSPTLLRYETLGDPASNTRRRGLPLPSTGTSHTLVCCTSCGL